MKVGIVVPHIFMHEDIIGNVIFSPGELALFLADGLSQQNVEVTLFTPGPVATRAINVTADLSLFNRELQIRGDSYLDLLKKHPFTFISLARQVQAELIAAAYRQANHGSLDVVHIFMNEEEIALPFASLCNKPVLFSHHDPFNFSVKYRSIFPKYSSLKWVSFSFEQRKGMPEDTNWVGNVYHGIPIHSLEPIKHPKQNYVAFLGRIIEPKGVHLAIAAIDHYNRHTNKPLLLKIAGKHYSDHNKDAYWQRRIAPSINTKSVEFVGHLKANDREAFIGNAAALLVPSLFDEPFGMVSIEALACGTPVIGLDSGAIPEIISDGTTGFIIKKALQADGTLDEVETAHRLAKAIAKYDQIDRSACRDEFTRRFTSTRMCREYLTLYEHTIATQDRF